MSKDLLDDPILVIGAARSGTQLLARLLAAHPAIAYIDEPTITWRHGNGHLRHEAYPESAARPEVVRYIRERFRALCAERGRSRIVEKSPANCLRLGFVRRVLPDARIVHVVRDGRDVAVSARKKYEGNPDKVTRDVDGAPSGGRRGGPGAWARVRTAAGITWRRLRNEPPGIDTLYWLPDLVGLWLTWLGIRRRAVWGPRIPGLRQLLRTHSTLEVAAIQWRTCVEQVLHYRAAHPELPFLQVRFEDLCRSPRETAARIYEFCGLEQPAALDALLDKILPVEARAFEKALTPEEVERVNEQAAELLLRLGYEL